MGVSGAEVARLCGVSKHVVYKAYKQGRLPAAGYTSLKKPLFDIVEARALFAARRPYKEEPTCPHCGRALSSEGELDRVLVASIDRTNHGFER